VVGLGQGAERKTGKKKKKSTKSKISKVTARSKGVIGPEVLGCHRKQNRKKHRVRNVGVC